LSGGRVNKFAITSADRIKASKRGHRASVVPQLISGGYATYWDMAKELGLTKEEAEYRYQKARKRGVWPISYEDLR
jgi:hypothetical protein